MSQTDTPRAIDKSSDENTGAPKRMARKCLNCGHYQPAGCVTVWLQIDNGVSEPRDDVRFRCSECDEVADQQVRILERWPGETL